MSGTKTKPSFRRWAIHSDIEGLTSASSSYDEMLQGMQLCMRGLLNQENGESIQMDLDLLQAEIAWHRFGRPYYKVWPDMAEALRRTKLDFSPEFLRAPYESLSVMLPVSFGAGACCLVKLIHNPENGAEQTLATLRSIDSRHPLRKQLEAELELAKSEDAHFGPVITTVSIAWRDADGIRVSATFPIRERETVESSLKRFYEHPDADEGIIDPILYLKNREGLIRIAVAVCMFGVDRHELVAPDVDREVIAARFPAGRSKASKALAVAAVARELAKSTGWRVGSEIDLPRPVVERGEVHRGAGAEREFGHYRSGHMRMQPCGEGGKDRKLIFVAPTLVRPDLPIRQSHGYRIRGKEPT